MIIHTFLGTFRSTTVPKVEGSTCQGMVAFLRAGGTFGGPWNLLVYECHSITTGNYEYVFMSR